MNKLESFTLDLRRAAPASADVDQYARQTASDRPGVAQPVPTRPVPVQPWNRIFLVAAVLFVALVGTWEWY